MADEAASVHAKKVQYEIIKCFPSASDLGMQAQGNPRSKPQKQKTATFYSQVAESESSGGENTHGVESPEELLKSVDMAIGRSNSNSVSAMLSLRQVILRGGQALKSRFSREGILLGEDISQPVLQPWPYTFGTVSDQLPSYPKPDSPSSASVVRVTDDAPDSYTSQLSVKAESADEAPFAIRLCVGYLEQPVALREEGIFRVPGDVTRIQQLQAALVTDEDGGSSNTRLRSFLINEISNELNPNTVAGLLKMYLRQKSMFSADESRQMADICRLAKGDLFQACRLMRDLLQRVTKRSYAILQSVIKLLMKVVEYSDENRMSMQALALSCGLSVFPEMFDTGDAVITLKFFLGNYDSLFVVDANE